MNEYKYYLASIKGEDNLVFSATSWDSVFIFLLNYYGKTTEHTKRIIKDIHNIEDKIHIFELMTKLEIDFVSILDNPILMDCADVRNIDEEKEEFI